MTGWKEEREADTDDWMKRKKRKTDTGMTGCKERKRKTDTDDWMERREGGRYG